MMEFALLNRLTAKPGQRDRVVEILLASGKLFDDNPACIVYLVGESKDVTECMPLLEGMPEQIPVQPAGGKVPAG
jgi:quinol monooxygenase YgiN